MRLTDENSWRCAVHKALKCRVYPKTQDELRKHYQQEAERLKCPHMPIDGPCMVCRVKVHRTGRGRQRDPTAMAHRTGIQYPRRAKYD